MLFVVVLSSKTKPDSVFFSPQILSETDKLGSTVGLVSGCTRKSFTSRSAVTEFIAKMMK